MWKYQWHGNTIFSHGSSNQKGVLVAFRYGLEYKKLSPEVVDDEGRFIILHIEIQGCPYVLINYYAPNIELNQVKKLQQIKRNLQNMSINENTQFILTGDWNVIFDRSLDSLGGSLTLKFNSFTEIQSLMIDYEFLDIWRARNLTLRQFTWRQKSPTKLSVSIFSLSQIVCNVTLRHASFFLLLKVTTHLFYWGLHQFKKVNTEEEDTGNLIIHDQ